MFSCSWKETAFHLQHLQDAVRSNAVRCRRKKKTTQDLSKIIYTFLPGKKKVILTIHSIVIPQNIV